MQLEEFVRVHGEELLRLAYTYVKSKEMAEDIVQDVLLKAYEARAQFRGEASYRTYLYRMTINRSHDYLRSWHYKNTVITTKIQRIFKGGKSAEQQMLANEQQTSVGAAVLALPIHYREVLVLYYYKELKIDDIASVLGCSSNTVKTRLRRGREQLKKQLKEVVWDELEAGN